MPNYYAPNGNFEVWNEKPKGYFTEEEWDKLYPIYEPTKEEKLAALKEDYEKTVSEWLANFASTRGYEVSNMGAYAISEHPIYSIEAKYFIQVQCDTWDACYVILNEALSGKKEIPTKNELFELLPISKAQWPIENNIAEDAAQM